MFKENPQVFFSEATLEHPSIPRLMLTRDQRIYNNRLEYTIDGKAQMETSKQMYSRYTWKAGRKATPSRTEGDFVKMDMSLFAKVE
jgi:hypothetical protein